MDLSRRPVPALAVFLSLAVLAIPASLSIAATPIYTYLDDVGVQHFTNQLDSVPEKYRSQMMQSEVGAVPDPPVASVVPALAGQPPPPPAVSAEPPVRAAVVRTVAASG